MTDLPEKIRNAFPQKRVVIVGDLVADQFLHGTIARVSREAPVFILRHDETNTVPGAAGNAAVNVASLGGVPVLVGVVGRDENGISLRDRLSGAGVDCRYIVTDQKLKTTTKVRVLAGQHYAARQQVIRIDYENASGISDSTVESLISNFRDAAETADAIIVSDYNYGVATAEIYDIALKIARDRGIPIIVDSRFKLQEYREATSATPNQEEVEQMLGKDFSAQDCESLRRDLEYKALLVTRGNKGMTLVEEGRPPHDFPAVGSDQPVDVTGAGDTVIAGYSLALASGFGFAEAAWLANHAGSIVVMKKGTASVSQAELIQSLEEERRHNTTESTVRL